MSEDVQRAKESVMKGEGYLHIKRLPKNTAREIIDFLNDNDEFGGDWAIGMKYIWDTFKGMLPPKDGQVAEQIALLHQRIDELEDKMRQKPSESAPKKMRMADGSVRRSEEDGKV